jgi:hypothetical protein
LARFKRIIEAMQWIALQDVKLERPEAIRRLVEIGLKAKK